MKDWKFVFLFLLVLIIVIPACDNDQSDDEFIGNWVRTDDFDGIARGEAVSFMIGDTGYVCTGYNSENDVDSCTVFLFQCYYNESKKQMVYKRKANFPGVKRTSAVAFSIGNKGYIGTGYGEVGDDYSYLCDFYSYDSETNTWAKIADFPDKRCKAVGFSINNIGYVGTGYNGNYLKEFYAYNPASNTWSQVTSKGGSKCSGSSAFVINNIAYVCCGINNAEYVTDFWAYDPAAGTGGAWTEKRKIYNYNEDEEYDDDYNIARYNAVSFVIDSKGYISSGSGGSILSTTWEYDPLTDLWIQKYSLEGASRQSAVSLSFSKRSFVLTGKSGSQVFDDCWEFRPNDENDDKD
jgi:N-acetylneuraminic acid mutarotase